MKTNYTVSFNANDALCLVKVNDMLVTDNGGMWKGQFTWDRRSVRTCRTGRIP